MGTFSTDFERRLIDALVGSLASSFSALESHLSDSLGQVLSDRLDHALCNDIHCPTPQAPNDGFVRAGTCASRIPASAKPCEKQVKDVFSNGVEAPSDCTQSTMCEDLDEQRMGHVQSLRLSILLDAGTLAKDSFNWTYPDIAKENRSLTHGTQEETELRTDDHDVIGKDCVRDNIDLEGTKPCPRESSLARRLSEYSAIDDDNRVRISQQSSSSNDAVDSERRKSQCSDTISLSLEQRHSFFRCRSRDYLITTSENSRASSFGRSTSRRTGVRRSGKILIEVERFGWLEWLGCIVRSRFYGYVVCALLLMNAATIGLEVNYFSDRDDSTSRVFRISETCFCVFFTFELLSRIVVYRLSFFVMPGLPWNTFDMCTVGLQVIELIMTATIETDSVVDGWVTKVAHALQLLRILRVLRIVRIVRDLDKLVYLIFASLWSFLWSLALLGILTYIIGVFITQLVVDKSLSDAASVAPGTRLHQRFGSILTSILSLFQAISGGIDWAELLDPLSSTISPALAPVFAIYVAFAVLVILNLVTGVFVEGAHKLTRDDREQMLLGKARLLFIQTDADDSGTITWGEFRDQLEGTPMKDLLSDIHLGLCTPEDFYWLIDRNGEGTISTATFMKEAFMLDQPARTIDIALVLKKISELSTALHTHVSSLEHRITKGGSPFLPSAAGSFDQLHGRGSHLSNIVE